MWKGCKASILVTFCNRAFTWVWRTVCLGNMALENSPLSLEDLEMSLEKTIAYYFVSCEFGNDTWNRIFSTRNFEIHVEIVEKAFAFCGLWNDCWNRILSLWNVDMYVTLEETFFPQGYLEMTLEIIILLSLEVENADLWFLKF